MQQETRKCCSFSNMDYKTATRISILFLAQVAEFMVPSTFEEDQKLNELEGGFFSKAVVHELRMFMLKLSTNEEEIG